MLNRHGAGEAAHVPRRLSVSRRRGRRSEHRTGLLFLESPGDGCGPAASAWLFPVDGLALLSQIEAVGFRIEPAEPLHAQPIVRDPPPPAIALCAEQAGKCTCLPGHETVARESDGDFRPERRVELENGARERGLYGFAGQPRWFRVGCGSRQNAASQAKRSSQNSGQHAQYLTPSRVRRYWPTGVWQQEDARVWLIQCKIRVRDRCRGRQSGQVR